MPTKVPQSDFPIESEDDLEQLIKYIIGYHKAKKDFDRELEEIINEPDEEDPK